MSSSTIVSPRHDTPDFEPDENWKAGLRRHIEEGLNSLVSDAKDTFESQCRRQSLIAADWERFKSEYTQALSTIRGLASEQYQDELDRERQKRRWASGIPMHPQWNEALVEEQVEIMERIKRSGGQDGGSTASPNNNPTEERRPTVVPPPRPAPPLPAQPTYEIPPLPPQLKETRNQAASASMGNSRRGSNYSTSSRDREETVASIRRTAARPAGPDRPSLPENWRQAPTLVDEPEEEKGNDADDDEALLRPPVRSKPALEMAPIPEVPVSWSIDRSSRSGSMSERHTTHSPPKTIPAIWKPSISPEEDAAASKPFVAVAVINRWGRTASIPLMGSRSVRRPSVAETIPERPDNAPGVSANLARERERLQEAEKPWNHIDKAREIQPMRTDNRQRPPVRLKPAVEMVPIPEVPVSRPIDRSSRSGSMSERHTTHSPPKPKPEIWRPSISPKEDAAASKPFIGVTNRRGRTVRIRDDIEEAEARKKEADARIKSGEEKKMGGERGRIEEERRRREEEERKMMEEYMRKRTEEEKRREAEVKKKETLKRREAQEWKRKDEEVKQAEAERRKELRRQRDKKREEEEEHRRREEQRKVQEAEFSLWEERKREWAKEQDMRRLDLERQASEQEKLRKQQKQRSEKERIYAGNARQGRAQGPLVKIPDQEEFRKRAEQILTKRKRQELGVGANSTTSSSSATLVPARPPQSRDSLNVFADPATSTASSSWRSADSGWPSDPSSHASTVNRSATDIPIVFDNVDAAQSSFTSLCDWFTAILVDKSRYQILLTFRDVVAQKMLDTIQTLLDDPRLGDPQLRKDLLVALLRLSKKSALYPTCYSLKCIQHGDEPVASGHFGEVWKGESEGHQVCLKVVKVFKKSQAKHLIKAFLKEAIVWKHLSHPNLLPFYGIYHLEDRHNRLCLVSPWMANGNIVDFLEQNTDVDRLPLISDILTGISYLHNENIVHGDLKGVNVVVTMSGRACLADFGLSSVTDADILRWTSVASTACSTGTTRWQAQELFNPEDEETRPTKESDIYSFSCICYEIFTGRVPFYEISLDSTVISKVMNGKRPSHPSPSVDDSVYHQRGMSSAMWSLMEDCWHSDPAVRPTAEQVLARLPVIAATETEELKGSDVLSSFEFRKANHIPYHISDADVEEIMSLVSESY